MNPLITVKTKKQFCKTHFALIVKARRLSRLDKDPSLIHSKLIKLARLELGYSDKTVDVDIITSINNAFNKLINYEY